MANVETILQEKIFKGFGVMYSGNKVTAIFHCKLTESKALDDLEHARKGEQTWKKRKAG